MDPYARLSREELIDRLKDLERKTTASSGDASSRTTERRLHEAALKDSEQRIRAIVNTAVEGIITIDERGLIESLNPAAEKMFGYHAEELLGRNVSVLMPPPYRQEHDGYLHNYRETGQAKIIGIGREVVGQRKDGTVFPMDLSVGEVKLAHCRLFTGIIRDITERKRAESKLAELAQTLAEKNKELETVVYVASHDLRSPLVNIQGFSRELAQACTLIRARLDAAAAAQPEIKTLLEEDIPEAINFILAGVAKIDALLSGFLRFSRLGRAALEMTRLNMNDMLAEIARTFEYELKQAEATLEIAPVPECYGDATQINQVFSNLIANAIKYLDRDRPGIIRIAGHREKEGSIYSVSDNGIGIAPEHQGKIFEIFHRLNPNANEGEGLGLTIAQRILERHAGRIWLDSTLGQGTTFFVSLPAAGPLNRSI
jgi:PAS domain S-box-containing protein